MSKKAIEHRVVMAKVVAEQWLQDRAKPEYRLRVYYGAREIRGLPGLLRSFRDGNIKIGSIESIPDLGIKEGFDHFIIWSSQREGLVKLRTWFENRGCETSGVW